MHRTDRLLLLILVLINLMVKCCWLGVEELSHDEPFTVYWSQRSPTELWAMMHTENNPPLYFLLIKAWSMLVPFGTAWLRVPSALFSALAAWPLFLLAHRLSGTRAAVVAGLLFTFSNYHFGFAHEVRVYSLFTLLTVTAMWLLVRGLGKPNNGMRAMLGLSAMNTVLVYTHFFGWLAIGLQLLSILLLPEFRPLRRNFLLGLGLTGVWYLPYATVFLGRVGQSVSNGTWLEPPVPEEIYNMIWRWSNAPVLAVLFLVIIAIGVRRTKARDLGIRIGLLWTFVPLLGMFAVSFAVPMFLDRYLVFAAPGFALLVALALVSALDDPRLKNVLSVAAVLGMLATFTPWKDDGRHPGRVVAQVDQWCTEDCSVEVLPYWYWLNYLAARDIANLRNDLSGTLHGKVLVSGTAGRTMTAMDQTDVATIIVVDAGSELVDPGRTWYLTRKATHPIVDSVEADHKVRVYRFRR